MNLTDYQDRTKKGNTNFSYRLGANVNDGL